VGERATRAAAQFPGQVKTLLQQALLLGDRFERQEVTPHGLAVATGRLEAAMDRLLDKNYRTASNERLAKHLRQQREYLFTFLGCPRELVKRGNCRGFSGSAFLAMLNG